MESTKSFDQQSHIVTAIGAAKMLMLLGLLVCIPYFYPDSERYKETNFLGAIPLVLLFAELAIVFTYRSWASGRTSPSADAAIVSTMVALTLSGFFLAFLTILSNSPAEMVGNGGLAFDTSCAREIWWGLCILTTLCFVQLNVVERLAVRRMMNHGIPIHSSAVDSKRPDVGSVLWRMWSAISTCSIGESKSLGVHMSASAGRYTVKHKIVILTSIFSIIAVSLSIYHGFPDAVRDPFLGNCTTATATISIVMACVTLLGSLSSLLHDAGFLSFPQDRSFRISTTFKMCLSMSKVVLTYQLTTQDHGMGAVSEAYSISFVLLVLSTAASFLVAAVLTFPGQKPNTAAMLERRGQVRPRMIVFISRLLWVCSKVGAGCLLVVVSAARPPYNDRIGGTLVLPAISGLGLAAGTLLTNEVTGMMMDPEINFEAIHSAGGVCILAPLMSLCFPAPLLGTILFAAQIDTCLSKAFTVVPVVAVLGIWVCSIILMCIVRQTPLKNADRASPLLDGAGEQ